jgi:hypothetical protein
VRYRVKFRVGPPPPSGLAFAAWMVGALFTLFWVALVTIALCLSLTWAACVNAVRTIVAAMEERR